MKRAVVRLEIDVPHGIRLVCLNYPDGTTDEIDLDEDGGRASDDDQAADDDDQGDGDQPPEPSTQVPSCHWKCETCRRWSEAWHAKRSARP